MTAAAASRAFYNDDPITPDPKEKGTPGDPFYFCNLVGDYSLGIAGHSHSPLFSDDTKELVAGLFKMQAIDHEAVLRMLNPPNKNNLIHSLRQRQKKQALAAAQRAAMGQPEPGPRGGKKANGQHPPV